MTRIASLLAISWRFCSSIPSGWRDNNAVIPRDMDFSLRTGSAAADAGFRAPNLNGNFGGKAPDLGALEIGQSAPVYGPRR
jgi:hypothetical protein